ncbi:hypothetical protein TNCV_3424281 [Trichonephila clavipes]|nr:hypothetical protein TNCV_3424281 [Trichonephila clavipes]
MFQFQDQSGMITGLKRNHIGYHAPRSDRAAVAQWSRKGFVSSRMGSYAIKMFAVTTEWVEVMVYRR